MKRSLIGGEPRALLDPAHAVPLHDVAAIVTLMVARASRTVVNLSSNLPLDATSAIVWLRKNPAPAAALVRFAQGSSMNEIRAFVGHSFTQDDAEVVRSFLRFFDQLSSLHPTFSWEHAEAAEPKVLAEKVMSLVDGKNVFIGICTRKERVVAPGSLTKLALRPHFAKVAEDSVEWKTSDWIIQEIGLAKGRRLELILLIESGVRKPGGLQGDVEYISFDRAAPEKSFGKILEMIRALSPRTASPTTAPLEDRSMPADRQAEPASPMDDDWTTPKPDWERYHYEFAFMHMLTIDDIVGSERIDKAYLNSKDAATNDNLDSWKAYIEFIRLTLGKGGALANLKSLADTHPGSSRILGYAARMLARYGNHAEAARAFEAAAGKERDDADAFDLLGHAAVQYCRARESDRVSAIVKTMKVQVETNRKRELQLLKALRELAEVAKEDEVARALMERIVEIDAGDTDSRFSLAYKHSACGSDDLSLLHYLRIPHAERGSMTWNNLGVAFDQNSLPAKSVDAYKKAAELGETLAMSNLAEKLIDAGFISEAQKHCDAALAFEHYHKNVGRALARLKEVPDEENLKQEEALEKALPKSEFYRQFGRAVSLREPEEIAQEWEGPDCVLRVKLDGPRFVASGSYEQRSNALSAGALMGFRARGALSESLVRFRVEYTGTLRGRSLEARIFRTHEGALSATNSLLGLADPGTKALVFLIDDGSELRVMESPEGSSPRFYTLKRHAKGGEPMG